MTISYYQEAGVTANNGVDAEETAAATAATTDALTAIGTLTAKYVVAVVPVSSFLSVSGTFCLITDSSGNVTTDDYNVVYATVPLGSTFSVTSVTSNDLVEVGTPGLITAATDTLAGNGLSATLATENSSSASIKPSAVGSFTVRLSANGAQQTATDAIYVTVVASCASSTWSPDKSFIENQVTGAVSQADDNVDDTPFWADGTVARVALRIKSAYDSDVPAGTWVVSATNGAKVGINSGGAGTGATCGSTTAASVYGTGADIKIAVCQGTDYTAQVTTVTVSYGATTILTRTILITGDVAKLTISSVEQGRTGTQTFRVFKASAYDAAGNRVSVNPSADVTTLDQNVTAADIGTTSVSADVQNANFITCGAGAKGSTNVKFKVTANSGATVTSDAIKFSCGDSLRTYTASLDKATYVPGDIATLTITYKDINGGVPYDSYNAATGNATDDVVQYVNGSNVAPAISGSQMTAIAAPAAGDIVAGGVKTYQFVVGSTEGSYQMAVNLTGITTDVAKAVSYSVKSSTTSVTNAEVLAAIVKLIASINKQIRALQKSLRR
jgi:hypothetical protein